MIVDSLHLFSQQMIQTALSSSKTRQVYIGCTIKRFHVLAVRVRIQLGRPGARLCGYAAPLQPALLRLSAMISRYFTRLAFSKSSFANATHPPSFRASVCSNGSFGTHRNGSLPVHVAHLSLSDFFGYRNEPPSDRTQTQKVRVTGISYGTTSATGKRRLGSTIHYFSKNGFRSLVVHKQEPVPHHRGHFSRSGRSIADRQKLLLSSRMRRC